MLGPGAFGGKVFVNPWQVSENLGGKLERYSLSPRRSIRVGCSRCMVRGTAMLNFTMSLIRGIHYPGKGGTFCYGWGLRQPAVLKKKGTKRRRLQLNSAFGSR